MSVKSNVFLIMVLTFVSTSVLGKPVTDETSSTICYDLNCPRNTTACYKRSEISSTDKTKLDVQIQCLDSLGNIVLSKNTSEDHPFGPGVYYKGTKLSITKSNSFANSLFLDFPGTNTDDDDDQIRLIPIYFTHGAGDYYPSKPKTGPKSEVEDLNEP